MAEDLDLIKRYRDAGVAGWSSTCHRLADSAAAASDRCARLMQQTHADLPRLGVVVESLREAVLLHGRWSALSH